MDLNTIWFILIGVLLTGYAILDGFDLGVGSLHLLAKNDLERRILINSIGPVWDGNEVWLVTGGGALFAAFPHVYATVFSGFYTAFMLLLFMIIFRAVSIEFRSKVETAGWRNTWDRAFSVSSFVIALLMGVALGNIVIGVPLDANFEPLFGLLDLLNPYSILIGLTTVVMFMMHGSLFLTVKTEGELNEKAKRWAKNSYFYFVACYLATTILTVIYVPHMTAPFNSNPVLYAIPLINLLAIANIAREHFRGKPLRAFISSGVNIACLMALFAVGLFPDIVISSPAPENSLNVYNAASSPRTLETMLIIALIGMPLVIGYTIFIYRIFRGKVKIEETSY